MIVGLRAMLAHLVLVALGGWAVWAQLTYRTPNRLAALLLVLAAIVFTGVMLAFLLHALVRGPRAASERGRVSMGMYRACAFVTFCLALYGLALFNNAQLDVSAQVTHRTEVVSLAFAEGELDIAMPVVWATVRSWRERGAIDRIPLRWDERQRLAPGQPVIVVIRKGFFKLPWIARIEPDVEKRSRQILAVLPDATRVWRDLAEFYVRVGRYSDAAATGRDYARRFPDDHEFPVKIAKLLVKRERFADVITLLGASAAGREDADIYMLLGYAMAMHGQRREGLAYLERARTMEPAHWWPHYALGWAYGAAGEYTRAVASFEKATQLRSGLDDAERELLRLRPMATATRVAAPIEPAPRAGTWSARAAGAPSPKPAPRKAPRAR